MFLEASRATAFRDTRPRRALTHLIGLDVGPSPDPFKAGRPYPFMPVRVMPWMNQRWKIRKTMTTGTVRNMEPARTWFQKE